MFDSRSSRREALVAGGSALSVMLAGCQNPLDSGSPDPLRSVSITAVDHPPELPFRPGIEVIEPAESADRPALLEASVENTADYPIELGEERAIVFEYVHSEERLGLVLLPRGETDYPAVEAGCWRLTEPIAIAEYYGVVSLEPGETTTSRLGVWGASTNTDGCLPTGEFRLETTYGVGRDETDGLDEQTATADWGFSLEVT